MVTFIKDNFRHLKDRLHKQIVTEIDGICYDLGVSSPCQLDQRNCEFLKRCPLDMRMNQEASLTAYEVVNQYDYHDLVQIFFKYGEDKFPNRLLEWTGAWLKPNRDNDWVKQEIINQTG